MKTQNSFVIYKDNYDTIKKLPDKERLELYDTIFKYQTGEEMGELSFIVEIAFDPIKRQFDRDKEKWEDEIQKRREAGKLGGIAKASNSKQDLANVASAKSATEFVANVADSVSVPVSVPVPVSVSVPVIISSKEDKEQALETIDENDGEKEYGKKEITLMQKFLRQAVGVSRFKDSKERFIVSNCYKLMTKIGKEEFKYRLETILKDDFKSKNCNKLSYLYGELVAFIHSPVVETSQNKVSSIIF